MRRPSEAVVVALFWLVLGCGRTELTADPPPVAIIEVSPNALTGETVTFDGSRSEDPSGEPLSYAWRLTRRPPGAQRSLEERTGPRVRLRPDATGLWSVELVVSAGDRSSVPAPASTTVAPGTSQVIANAGPDQQGFVGDRFTLNGSQSSDSAGRPLRYQWSLSPPPGSAAQLIGPTSVAPGFTADHEGTYAISLMVTAGAQTDVDELTVSVSGRPIVVPEPDAGPPVPDSGVPDAGAPDAGVADAGVADAGPVDVLDPRQVYLSAPLRPGTCGDHALVNLVGPRVVTTGFDCSFWDLTAVIRPTDGRLVYKNSSDSLLREYHCDACPYAGIYGSQVLANDPVLPQGCPNGDPRLSHFLVSPQGDVLHSCYSGPTLVWYDAAGQPIDVRSEQPVAFGADGWVLTTRSVLNVQTGERHPVTNVQPNSPAIRWSPPDAFWILENARTLWRIPVGTGIGQRLGSYGPPPQGWNDASAKRFAADGALYGLVYWTALPVRYGVMRCVLGGACVIVHDEATDPMFRLQRAWLVTGP